MNESALSAADHRRLVDEILSGAPLLVVAAEYGITRDAAAGMLHRWLLNGETGLPDGEVVETG